MAGRRPPRSGAVGRAPSVCNAARPFRGVFSSPPPSGGGRTSCRWRLPPETLTFSQKRHRDNPSAGSVAPPTSNARCGPASRRALSGLRCATLWVRSPQSRVGPRRMTEPPQPYDGQPFAPIGRLTAAEHAWGRRLIQRAWPELGWRVVGRDSEGHLVATAVLGCGASRPDSVRRCYQTLTPAGVVHRSVTVPKAAPGA